MAATAMRARSAMDLVRDENLPGSSAYRKIHELEGAGLLVVARTVVTSEGKSYKMYRAAFREVNVQYHAGEFVVTVVPTGDAVEKASRLFRSFAEES